ncbi:BREX protein BrxB domain-containing protein [Rhodovibrio salinarum]|uniref:DUF1788 domain-containing protein n=1 Tax=Rhodovibrio salinarum TaxID=1087 RepID=A0A934QJY2_9PROT|nr:BREX protein BrxB domain-containing protein [Rhodovibrio salinarum]MBK1698286.1 DUF1788 domain-containing protein [Rhodovibrio salinarum]
MSRLDDLAKRYRRNIELPWDRSIAGAQRVITLVYDKDLERALRGRMALFETATQRTGAHWALIDISDCFPRWLAKNRYCQHYFEYPEDLEIKLESSFAKFVSQEIEAGLQRDDVDEDTVVGLLGVGTLFGFARVSIVLNKVEPAIRGRLLVFFPGQYEDNTYRLFNARDGWNYLATPITLGAEEY